MLDNFNVDNYTPIANLFNALDYTVQDIIVLRDVQLLIVICDEVVFVSYEINDYFDYDVAI